MAELSKQDYLELAHRYMPGATITTFHVPQEFETVMVRGKGSHLYDIDGKEYVDYVLSSGPMLAGHAHPEVVEAVQKQVPNGTSFYYLNEPAILLAQKIVEASPCAEQVRFANSGAEATYYALRLARTYTGRSKILKFEGAFHGFHDYAMQSVTPVNPPDFPTPVPSSAGIPPSVLGEVLIAPFNDLERTTAIVEKYADSLAAIIVEAQCRLIDPKPGFLQGLRDLTRKHGIVLIFDEVVTGFRLAWGGCQELYGVTGDLATYGKVIGGGYPVSAVAGKAEIMERADPRHTGKPGYIYFSGTLSGNALCTTAGLATLKVLERPGTYERLRANGEYIRAGLKRITGLLGVPAQTGGYGAIFNLQFTETPIVDYRTSATADRELLRAMRSGLLRRGIWSLPMSRWYMSIAHSQEDLDRTLQAFEDSLREALANKNKR